MKKTRHLNVTGRRFVLLVALLIPTVAAAGPWTQTQGSSYLKISAGYLSTVSEFNHKATRQDLFEEDPGFEDGSFRDMNLVLYGEYGLFDPLTLVGSLPLKALRASRTGLVGGGLLRQRSALSTVGLGDLSASLRLRLLAEPVVLAVQAGLDLPFYGDAPDNEGPPLGSGEIDAQAHLLLGRSLGQIYVSTRIGYKRRAGRLHDEILFGAEGGRHWGRWLGALRLDAVRNVQTPPDIYGGPIVTPLPVGGGVLPDLVIGDQHSLKLNPSLTYTLSHGLQVQLEVLSVVSGTNTLAGTQWAIGVVATR
ncbi:MAG: hypothetical protein HOC05_20210 [Gemmatimonadetes bacterium]|nr:hypothetical protein [Gemmatimonadota bacterium]